MFHCHEGAMMDIETLIEKRISQDEYIFTLPVPPSANRYWRIYKNRIVVTDEAKAYKREISLLLRDCIPLRCNVSVNFTVFRPRMKGDLDNYNKIMFDAMQGLVYFNDSQIVEIHSYRKDDKKNPRVEILISRPEGYE
jgi:crossover junction endodeoxyribonuclease RusA